MSVQHVDTARMEAFGEKMLEHLNGAALTLMCSIGHRTGLFDTMSGMGPSTSGQIAERAGLNERYVREWLGAMVTGGIVEYDPETGGYYLPAEHAACLTRASTPNNAAVPCQWVAVLGGVEDAVVEAFEHGRGVPYSAYRRFHEVMAEESGQTTVAGLDEYILPAIPGLVERLEAGIDVLDVGCGSGEALMHMAGRFGDSRFVGYDLSEAAVATAIERARERGLGNVHFEALDLPTLRETATFDLITAFDAIHDQARPDLVLGNIRRALRPGGTFLMQDIGGSSHLHHNLDGPMSPFIYTISCMHCMSVSLAGGGMGLGAAWGREKALQMLHEAGFEDVRVERLEHDIQNEYFIMSKG